MNIETALKSLENEKNIQYKTLLQICTCFFEGPRVHGSHYIFKTPWKGQPWVNIQKDGKRAKTYQVRQVKQALQRLKEIKYQERKGV